MSDEAGLTVEEIRTVRAMIVTAELRAQSVTDGLAGLRASIEAYRSEDRESNRRIYARIDRLERFQWVLIGGLVMLVTGLPAAAWLVNLLSGGT